MFAFTIFNIMFIWLAGNIIFILALLYIILKRINNIQEATKPLLTEVSGMENRTRHLISVTENQYKQIVQTCLELKTAFEEVHNNMISKDKKTTQAMEKIANDIDRKADPVWSRTVLPKKEKAKNTANGNYGFRFHPHVKKAILDYSKQGLSAPAISAIMKLPRKTIYNCIHHTKIRQAKQNGATNSIKQLEDQIYNDAMKTLVKKTAYKPTGKKPGRPPKMALEVEDKIVELYNRGNKLSTIAELLKLPYYRVYNAFIRRTTL